MATDIKKIAEQLVGLTLLEAQELATVLKEEYGISPAAPVAVAAAGGGASAEASEEQTDFTVVLASIDDSKKIAVIKIVREITGLGLKEAKELVETPGSNIKEGASKEDAAALKEKLEAAGGKVELK